MKNQHMEKLMSLIESLNNQRFFEKFLYFPLSEYSILKEIYQLIGQNKNTTPSEIAENAKLSVPAISRTIKCLIDKGWVFKEQSATDKRSYHIQLTEEGKAQYLQQSKIFCDRFSQVLNLMSDHDLSALLQALEHMKLAMDDVIVSHPLSSEEVKK